MTSRYQILTLNPISSHGLKRFPEARYTVAKSVERPDAILVRSHDMHAMAIPASVKAIGRAGAGTNNIPVPALTKRGIPVFNAGEEDARRFMTEMQERLDQFGLQIEPSKTTLIRFGSQAAKQCGKDGVKRPATFNFLGFNHYVGKSRKGRFMVGRTTQRERIAKKLKEVSQKLAKLRLQGGKAMLLYARRHLVGHLAYYAVSGNARQIGNCAYQISRLLFKWFNRRSQRRS